MKKLLNVLTVILALLLWYSNADLFIRLQSINEPLSIGGKILNVGLALGVSCLTAICIARIDKFIYVVVFALLDGFSFWLHNRVNIQGDVFTNIGSAYYYVSLGYIICMIWYLHRLEAAKIAAEKSKLESKENTDSEAPKSEEITDNEPQKELPALPEYKYNSEPAIRGALNRGVELETVLANSSPQAIKKYEEIRAKKHPPE